VQALRHRVPRYSECITTIAGAHDLIAPPPSCRVRGATNHVIDEVSCDDRALASHGGLIFMRATLRLALATLAQPLVRSEPVRDAG
jgi:hypothetical protein